MKKTYTLWAVLLLAGMAYAVSPNGCQPNQVLVNGQCVAAQATQQDNCGFWARLMGTCVKEQPAPDTLGGDCGTVTPGTNDQCCKNKNPNFVWDQTTFRCVNSQAYNQDNCGFWGRLTGKCSNQTVSSSTSTTLPSCQQNQVIINGKCVGVPATQQDNCGFFSRLMGRCT